MFIFSFFFNWPQPKETPPPIPPPPPQKVWAHNTPPQPKPADTWQTFNPKPPVKSKVPPTFNFFQNLADFQFFPKPPRLSILFWKRLGTTMQGPGINRKDCLLVTDFGKFGFQSLLQRIAVLEKKLKVSSAVPRRLSIFFQDAQPPKQALRPNFPKSVTSKQSLH